MNDIMRYRTSLKELNSLTGKQAIHSGKVTKARGKSQGKTMSQAMSLGTQMSINGIDAMFRDGQDHCREVAVFKNDLIQVKLIVNGVFSKLLEL